MNLFTATPQWLRGALGVTKPELPTHLDTDRVIPVIDVGQGGLAYASLTREASSSGGWNQPASTAATTRIILPVLEAQIRIVWALEIVHIGGSTQRVFLGYRWLTSGTTVDVGKADIPADERWNLSDFVGNRHYLVVPPGVGLAMSWPATAAGETYDGEVLFGVLPAGFKVT